MSEPEAKADDKGKKKGGNKLFLIIGVVVLLLGAGGGYWWFARSAAAGGEHAEGAEGEGAGGAHADAGSHDEEADAEDGSPAKKKKRKKFKQPAAMVDLDPFVVNLADPAGNRYVKARISLGVDEAEAAAELGGGGGEAAAGAHGGGGGEDDPGAAASHALTKTRVRAVILEILASYTAEEITSRDGKTSLKEEIIEEVSALLHNGEVMEVLLTDLIVQ
jgi:flagellar FliL protein